ncbi:MAG: polyprenyl synthetase family protein [Myxococcota bacterium]
MAELQDWMTRIKGAVDGCLETYFAEKAEESKDISADSIELLDGVRSLTMRGGKRFRPMMVEAGYRSVSPKGPADAALNAGAALEVLQSYLLIHDDWMDQDEERRGGPAVHVMYRDRYETHLADSLGILAGDLASAYALELLCRSPFAASDLPKGLAIFLRIQKEVFFGQHLDITMNANVARMHDLKTTSYTVRGPLLLGASLGGASIEQSEALSAYAGPLGEAFQLADDLLGTFGDFATTGKPGNDLRNRKRNSLVSAAEERLAPGERAPLDRVMGGEGSEADVTAATELLVSSGAKAAVQAKLESQLAAAKTTLDGAPISDEGRSLLFGLADRLALRSI